MVAFLWIREENNTQKHGVIVMSLEEKLVLLRKQKGLSQMYVAEQMEISQQEES